MQEVLIKRSYQKMGAVIGMLTIDGVDHLPIFTLENPWLNNSPNISCIPAGDYLVERHYSPKYGNCYQVADVASRTHILFHAGNTAKDTKGCILLGMGAGEINGKPAITSSRVAVAEFEKLMNYETFRLTIEV